MLPVWARGAHTLALVMVSRADAFFPQLTGEGGRRASAVL